MPTRGGCCSSLWFLLAENQAGLEGQENHGVGGGRMSASPQQTWLQMFSRLAITLGTARGLFYSAARGAVDPRRVMPASWSQGPLPPPAPNHTHIWLDGVGFWVPSQIQMGPLVQEKTPPHTLRISFTSKMEPKGRIKCEGYSTHRGGGTEGWRGLHCLSWRPGLEHISISLLGD